MASANWAKADERKVKAENFVKQIMEENENDIRNSIANTSLYDRVNIKSPEKPNLITNCTLEKKTTDGALYDFLYPEVHGTLGSVDSHITANMSKVAVLNFASYKIPGGGFLSGAMAQEEALCHTSTLYPVLASDTVINNFYAYNNQHLNKGLYTDRALYTEGIVFKYPNEDKIFKADVISCAAPNNSIIAKYEKSCPYTPEENKKALLSRIDFVKDICLLEKVDTVILGAWGCGVFNQDANLVAKAFREAFEGTGINCIYAIPDNANYEKFQQAFLEYDTEKTVRDYITKYVNNSQDFFVLRPEEKEAVINDSVREVLENIKNASQNQPTQKLDGMKFTITSEVKIDLTELAKQSLDKRVPEQEKEEQTNEEEEIEL